MAEHPTQRLLNKMTSVAQAVLLRDLQNGRLLLVANTHLQLEQPQVMAKQDSTHSELSSIHVWLIQGTIIPRAITFVCCNCIAS